ncbi:MAG: peptidoglycan-binding domain-containing protein [Hyphomicrobium sp.]
MRSLGGFVLLAGIGVGLFVYLPTPVDRHTSLENVQRLWTKSDRLNIPALAPAVSRSFSPNLSLAKLTPPEPRRAKRSESSTARGARAAVTAPAPMLAVHRTVMSWQPVVSATAVAIKSGSGAASLKPKDSTSRYKLVVEIQRKLKKRGCYWGRIDGSWGAGSKYAMQEFIDRINATLPIEQPDYVLLTLLQANGDKSCGACPSGHTATVGGSCVPQTIVAEVLPWQQAGAPQATGQPLLRPVGTTIVTTAPLAGRMAIGGPKQSPPPSIEDDFGRRSVAAATFDDSNRANVLQPVITRAPAARPAYAAAPRKAKRRSRRRYRRVRAARRRNLMLSLGGRY